MKLSTTESDYLATIHKHGLMTLKEAAVATGETEGFIRRLIMSGYLVNANEDVLPKGFRGKQQVLFRSDLEQWWDHNRDILWTRRKITIEKFIEWQPRRRPEYLRLLDVAHYYAGRGDACMGLLEWQSEITKAAANRQFDCPNHTALFLFYRRPQVKIDKTELHSVLKDWPACLAGVWIHKSAYVLWARRNGHPVNDMWVISENRSQKVQPAEVEDQVPTWPNGKGAMGKAIEHLSITHKSEPFEGATTTTKC